MNEYINEFNQINDLIVKENVPLKKYTTFEVGGPADLFLVPKNSKALKKLTKIIKTNNLNYFVLGKGSNIIVGDKGYRGIIIYTGQLNNIEVFDNKIVAQSGATLKKLSDTALENSLTGIEFACGIPGSLGGAVFMNAGAYGGEMNNIIKTATAVNNNGQEITFKNEELNLSYRNSIFQDNNYIILKAVIQLKKGNQQEIKKQIDTLNKKREQKQPLEYPSAGSSFKRPEGYYTGPLIEKANMKGYQIGGAQVSKKHAGFIINKDNATAEDIVNLIKKIQEEVYKISGVELEPEPKFLGEF
ncbi:MAG: UDP-N-acetylmuramate dehydrogenase [Halanaerobiales bacterium]|nr:UDP-N-acetylmuramate dehydrogenase [Halanaerobiales bacterium]